LKEVQMAGDGDSRDGLTIDAGIGIGAEIVLIRGIADRREVAADRILIVVERVRRVARDGARAVVRQS